MPHVLELPVVEVGDKITFVWMGPNPRDLTGRVVYVGQDADDYWIIENSGTKRHYIIKNYDYIIT